MGISRDSLHKRRATGGKQKPWRKKRKYELGRQAAMTKLSSNVCVRRVRVRGGNSKFRALRLDHGNFSWGSEAVTRKVRILDVSYNASNNELVRTQTLVKSAIIQVDAAPFKQWYQQHYGLEVGQKRKGGAAAAAAAAAEGEAAAQSNHVKRKLKQRNQGRKLDQLMDDQFATGRLYAAISSRPGQCGRADGYILEGRELEFYVKKMQKKKGKGIAASGSSQRQPAPTDAVCRPSPPPAAAWTAVMAPKAPKGDVLQQKSPAEFFADNRTIAGFDNPGKCLYTTIRELVENALDAAESISTLPEIDITVEEISQSRLNRLRGVTNHDRIDEELYQDFETAGAKQKRLAKEAKELEKLEKQAAKRGDGSAAVDAKKKEFEVKRAAQAAKAEKVFFKVTVRDNGMGMSHKDIPEMLGRVLSGTKYGVKQTRGKFGLGAKMALIWSKMSTGLPIEVTSARRGSAQRSYYKLDLDIQRNQPNVHEQKLLDNPGGWHGAELSVVIAGNWTYYRAKALKYLQQIAVITPYSQFKFLFKAEDEKSSLAITFARRTTTMPQPPQAVKHHPAAVDLELIKRLAGATPCTTLVAFLSKEFDCVSRDYAEKISLEMRCDPHTSPAELTPKQIVAMHDLLHQLRFANPDGNHLSPAGEYNLRLGIMKELRPEMVATHQGGAGVHEGHAFIVEAAVSVGGRNIKPGLNIYRFANRIPLLFEGGSDVITRTALKRINWSTYKINQSSDKVGVFVSLVSTKIPFKGAGKEYIADDVEEIQAAVRAAIQQCCVQLKSKIARQQAAREQKLRKKNLTKYIPNVAAAVYTVLQAVAKRRDDAAGGAAAKRRRLEPDQALVVAGVRSGEVTEAALVAKLQEHVEQIDVDMALEYQLQQGIADTAKVDACLMPVSARHDYGPEMHCAVGVIRRLQEP
ncbi:DNA topoisomerase 6 subunit B isoform B [Micractinium conductrix]|uniref:DNA topoisomerase 6 subunit B n=1 Tax=Micractinium conductrix TaxID=554055 RepID=A0A2P6V8R8_9CHLO|nr:DNA topoisomerase 6 subunit B isoform B [Micractinium conductrix]|eukprot:PSC70486.1 DNA topoisomerase 6 subunit B isoform B [Micractinium conductrix]